jgi:2-polyprenyl-3-methyl-5-hydroxy-6-metoxy-1,4-benzoquinol methylase
VCGSGRHEEVLHLGAIPTNNVVLLDDADEARSWPTGELRLTQCLDCAFVTNSAYRADLVEYSSRIEETQAFSPHFMAYATALAESWVSTYDLTGATVLEVGCGTGSILASLRPSRGLGVDLSPRMIAIAAARHPELEFIAADAAALPPGEQFDFVIVPDVIEHLSDPAAVFRAVLGRCHAGTLVIVACVSPRWAPVLHLAERLGLKMPEGEHRWLPAAAIGALARDAGFEVRDVLGRTLLPKRVPGLSGPLNRLARRRRLRPLCLTQVLILVPGPGPRSAAGAGSTCSDAER